MIRALLDGTKSQTRRICKHAVETSLSAVVGPFELPGFGGGWFGDEEGEIQFRGPHGQAGDRLWVRETFYAYGRWVTRFSEKKKRDEWHFIDMTLACDRAYQYAADNPEVPLAKGRGGGLPGWYTRPAIFMPRAACRILLDITGVRVERLNGCSETDALAEGIDTDELAERQDSYDIVCKGTDASGRATAQSMYRDLWESINGAGSWDANPLVWVITFSRTAP